MSDERDEGEASSLDDGILDHARGASSMFGDCSAIAPGVYIMLDGRPVTTACD